MLASRAQTCVAPGTGRRLVAPHTAWCTTPHVPACPGKSQQAPADVFSRLQPISLQVCHAATRPAFEEIASGTEVGADDAAARAFAVQCAEVADETKCQDISVLHVAPHVSWTSYMVFATVFSRPQLLAAMARLERMVDEDHPDRQRQNQPGTSPWECLDYGDVVIHLMTADQREAYDVEGFYAAAEEVDLPFALPGNSSGNVSTQPTWSKQY